mmetsp:Transcript_1565/g.4042  ORF Transcript_1565/g.4042 Transcript_1565/m.4042 type:complete len:213 (+) Transcript_1565:57-695(+)
MTALPNPIISALELHSKPLFPPLSLAWLTAGRSQTRWSEYLLTLPSLLLSRLRGLARPLVDLALHALGVLRLDDLGVRQRADDVALHNRAAESLLLAQRLLLVPAHLLVQMLLTGPAGHDLAATGDLVPLGRRLPRLHLAGNNPDRHRLHLSRGPDLQLLAHASGARGQALGGTHADCSQRLGLSGARAAGAKREPAHLEGHCRRCGGHADC